MSNSPFHDPRVGDLLSRVGEDISLLRDDIRHLVKHTARHTLPGGARELAESARSSLTAGKMRTAEHLRSLREQPNQPATWVGGAIIVGLIAAGIYWFCNEGCHADQSTDD